MLVRDSHPKMLAKDDSSVHLLLQVSEESLLCMRAHYSNR